ncbi:MAG: patatin-like phospholipase domain-containing protein, partial [Beijerinckiaceae bacterium]|nr:patatin-like phospholipase domain-containing protein [Beijerinckiaceae bacterium]
MRSPDSSEDYSVWHELDEAERREIRAAMRARRVARGETLIARGSPSAALFIVNFGSFDVMNNDNSQIVAEIGRNQLIGEMGFFSGMQRTASVIAARDSEVFEIDRAGFDELMARCPKLQRAILRSLAGRLARLAEIVGGGVSRQSSRACVVAAIRAGSGEMPEAFLDKWRKTAMALDRSCFLTSSDVQKQLGSERADPYTIANWLAEVERNHDLVICIADDALTGWTQTALHSADQVLMVASGSPDVLNDTESLALTLFPLARRRLVRLHARRTGAAESTAPWLRLRDVFMVHHLAMEDDKDFYRLGRFLTGQAIGFVAGGGGAFGPAHIGIFKAFHKSGIEFDIHGGASVGAAMTAAFSLLIEPEEFETSIQDMFVRRNAMERLTLPRYGLLDHTILDRFLEQTFGSSPIEDAWKPYFALAANLSTYTMRILRTGPIWEAVRASCAIPGVLPPFFDHKGHMLVDGAVADNVPLTVMKSLKAGPNLVVDLRPKNERSYKIDYKSIPGRWEILA